MSSNSRRPRKNKARIAWVATLWKSHQPKELSHTNKAVFTELLGHIDGALSEKVHPTVDLGLALEPPVALGIQAGTPPTEPPRFGISLLWVFLSKTERDAMMGDLTEEYQVALCRVGPRAAKLWFYKQVLTSLWPMLQATGRTLTKWGLVGLLEEIIRRIAH